jgi:hypothetical protein
MDAITKKQTRSHNKQPHEAIHGTRLHRRLAEAAHDDPEADQQQIISNLDYAYDFVGTGLLVIRT